MDTSFQVRALLKLPGFPTLDELLQSGSISISGVPPLKSRNLDCALFTRRPRSYVTGAFFERCNARRALERISRGAGRSITLDVVENSQRFASSIT